MEQDGWRPGWWESPYQCSTLGIAGFIMERVWSLTFRCFQNWIAFFECLNEDIGLILLECSDGPLGCFCITHHAESQLDVFPICLVPDLQVGSSVNCHEGAIAHKGQFYHWCLNTFSQVQIGIFKGICLFMARKALCGSASCHHLVWQNFWRRSNRICHPSSPSERRTGSSA